MAWTIVELIIKVRTLLNRWFSMEVREMAKVLNATVSVFLLICTLQLNAGAVTKDIEILNLPKECQRGDKVTVRIKTSPGAQCKIAVQDLPMTEAVALRDQKANKNGLVSWTFKVNKDYKADLIPIVFTSDLGKGVDQKCIASIALPARQANDAIKLTLVEEPKKVIPGQEITISVLATPGTQCKIEAQDAGITQAINLADKSADKSGKVSWTFKVRDDYKADRLPLIITGTNKDSVKKLVCDVPINRM